MEDPRETVCGRVNDGGEEMKQKKKKKIDAEREQNRWHEVYNWYTIYKSLKYFGHFLPRTALMLPQTVWMILNMWMIFFHRF